MVVGVGVIAVSVMLRSRMHQTVVDHDDGPLAGHDAADARDQLAVWSTIEPDHAPALIEAAAAGAFRSAHSDERSTIIASRVVAFDDGHPVVRIDASVGGARSGEQLVEYWAMRHLSGRWEPTGSVDEETGTTRYLTG